jgi:hypothetical protein
MIPVALQGRESRMKASRRRPLGSLPAEITTRRIFVTGAWQMRSTIYSRRASRPEITVFDVNRVSPGWHAP